MRDCKIVEILVEKLQAHSKVAAESSSQAHRYAKQKSGAAGVPETTRRVRRLQSIRR